VDKQGASEQEKSPRKILANSDFFHLKFPWDNSSTVSIASSPLAHRTADAETSRRVNSASHLAIIFSRIARQNTSTIILI